jgi:hypothetical protein
MSGVVEFALRGTTLRFSIERDELRGLDPLRITQRLERLAIRVPDELNDTRSNSEHLRQQVDAAQRRLGDVFPHDEELRRLEIDLADLDDQLTERDERPTAPDPADGSLQMSR